MDVRCGGDWRGPPAVANRRRIRILRGPSLAMILCAAVSFPRTCRAFLSSSPVAPVAPFAPSTEATPSTVRTHPVTSRKATVEKTAAAAGVPERRYFMDALRPVSMEEEDYNGSFVNVTHAPPLLFGNNHTTSDTLVSPHPHHHRHESIVQDHTTNESGHTDTNHNKLRSMWRRRHARSAQEGIRREKLPQLSSLLERAGAMEHTRTSLRQRQYMARTIRGLIAALAEEAVDLEVHVDSRKDTPLWEKQVDAVKIQFSRLSFKPLRIGGVGGGKTRPPLAEEGVVAVRDEATNHDVGGLPLLNLDSADEAFEQIDVDNSGALDRDEIIRALNMAAGCLEEEPDDPRSQVIQNIATELFQLYDFNGDGVVDRNEYQSLVEDMAALSSAEAVPDTEEGNGWLSSLLQGTKGAVSGFLQSVTEKNGASPAMGTNGAIVEPAKQAFDSEARVVDLSDASEDVGAVAKSLGSITFSDLKLDLRRLLFGAVPFVKHITPGGPLILEPFTMTVTGSFSAADIMDSSLLDAGLGRLVAMVLRRRMRSFRDLVDLAILKGRDWKMASATAPVTQVTELSSVEFDEQNRMIITGRAKIRTRPGAPTITQAFKVRVRAGTRAGGRFIRLVEPELAFVLECPKQIEEGVGLLFSSLDMNRPARPKPLYSFLKLYSPFKVDDSDGFDLGDDNRIKKLYIEDGALKFEMSVTVRPGRFLGNHYIATSVPNRTFIITLDRVKEGMRSARRAKQAAKAALPKSIVANSLQRSTAAAAATVKRAQPTNFFSRFVNGYLHAEREDGSTPVTTAIRDFFVKQVGKSEVKT